MEIRVIERWLNEGWSPLRIGYGAVSLVALAITVYGYASHPHHLGAVWWLLTAVAVLAIWAASEMVRWRTRYKRSFATGAALVPTEPYPMPSATIRTASASLKAKQLETLRGLLKDGQGLRNKITVGYSSISYTPKRLTQRIARWEAAASLGLEDWPHMFSQFQEEAPDLDIFAATRRQSYDRITYQLQVLEITIKLARDALRSDG